MTLIVFMCFILLSLVLTVLARRGVITNNIHEILVANRGLGAFLLFFITLGEIYGIGTLIGVPGAVYSKGSSYVIWFVGYILLAYPIGYFINPRIWRIGRISNSATIGDFFAWRFDSKWLGFLIAVISMVVLLPWAQMQFTGLSIILRYLGVEINNTAAIVIAAAIAFLYVGLCGVRGSAYVAILKDLLMVSAIIIGGVVAAMKMPGGMEGIYREAFARFPTYLTVVMEPIDKNVTFLISTVLVQSVGLYMFPFIFQYVFSAGSERIVRFNQVIMPLYMMMYVFLVTAAFFCLVTVPGLKNPDDAFMGMIVANVPSWVVGICAAGGALTCMLVLADIALSMGGIITRNILNLVIPNAPQAQAVIWTRLFIAAFLGASVLLTIFFPTLLLGLLNVAYFGIVQFLPGVLGIILWQRVSKWGIVAGLAAGFAGVICFNVLPVVPYNINKGLVALLINGLVMVVVSLLSAPDAKSIAKLMLTRQPMGQSPRAQKVRV